MKINNTSVWRDGGSVLVVDDEQETRHLLKKLLLKAGHRVMEAVDGEMALQKVMELPPDVVLLDVLMPRMDGVEVCGRLKADPLTAALPVIMITSLTARNDRLRGIEAGADDFLNKPVDKEELLLRVRNAIRTKRLFDQVHDDYRRLRMLEEVEGDLFRMIVRDMREPLSLVRFELEIQKRLIGELGLGVDMKHMDAACDDVSTLVETANSVLGISQLSAAGSSMERDKCDLAALAGEVVESSRPGFGGRTVGVESRGETTSVWCNGRIVRQALARLVSGAIKATPENSVITVSVTERDDCVRVAVLEKWPPAGRDSRTVAVEVSDSPWDRIGQTFCKLVVRMHGGRTGFENRSDNAWIWWFELPQARQATGIPGEWYF